MHHHFTLSYYVVSHHKPHCIIYYTLFHYR